MCTIREAVNRRNQQIHLPSSLNPITEDKTVRQCLQSALAKTLQTVVSVFYSNVAWLIQFELNHSQIIAQLSASLNAALMKSIHRTKGKGK